MIAATTLRRFALARNALFPLSSSNDVKYVRGFRNTQWVETQPGDLPSHTNPKNHPKGLVTEQFTGPQGFTGEASSNGPLRLWLYKQQRTLKIGSYSKSSRQPFHVTYHSAGGNPLRIKADQTPLHHPTDFLQGLEPFGSNEHILHYSYRLNQSMSTSHQVFHNLDGEMLIQPSQGSLTILTECGKLELSPGVIGVIPKNMKVQINLACDSTSASGVITELKNDRSFRLPHRGPLGANGLANPEYFQSPTPFVDQQHLSTTHHLTCKKQNTFLQAQSTHSPFDVSAWKGNYAPYRFALADFVPVVAGQKDHLDPSSHLVLAVGGEDGANFVELVVFAPRYGCTTESQPTYLPPYDHRNNGKAELMHYLGSYDARVGSAPGDQTLHDMGVAHGNDQATFDKVKNGPNQTIFLNMPPATMVEVTGYLEVTEEVLRKQDPTYHPSLQGVSTGRPQAAELGKSRQLTFTALEQSLVPLFNVLMPNPTVTVNPLTGHTTRQYINSSGDAFLVKTNHDQNLFWSTYKADSPSASVPTRDVSSASDQELHEAAQTVRSFFNRGTVVQNLCLEVNDPRETADHFYSQGLYQGMDNTTVSIEPKSPFGFKFVPMDHLAGVQPNDQALVSTIDHTVINCYKSGLDTLFTLFPSTFWGGDPRDLRAPGVQFYTRVLTNDSQKVPQMVPVNNLDESEEELLKRIQAQDSFVPPYLQQAVMNNQISRGLYDTNRQRPQASYNAFLQHIAMAVNQQYGDISIHLERLKNYGLTLIPPPPMEYYRLSEVDLSQRLVLPTLFRLEKYDVFELPYQLFNGLLKPKDANIDRLYQILRDSQVEEHIVEDIIRAFKKMQPVLQLIGESVADLQVDTLQAHLEQEMLKQGFHFQQADIKLIMALLMFNRQKIEKSAQAGSLLDFQIIQERKQSGYIDQTFSTPVSQATEGTSGLFFEFITRTCYDDVLDLIEAGKITLDTTEFKSCGAFGQGNFANLMLGQQKGIEQMDRVRQQQAKKGEAFQLPLLDLATIESTPTQHMHQFIEKTRANGESDKAEVLLQAKVNIDALVAECRKRNIW